MMVIKAGYIGNNCISFIIILSQAFTFRRIFLKKQMAPHKVEKLLFSHNFPSVILSKSLLYISVHFVFLTSIMPAQE